MHELSIAQGLLDAVRREAEARGGPGARVTRVRLAAGQMQGIVGDALRMAWEVLAEATPASGSVLEVTEVPVAARCRGCGRDGGIEWPFFACPACGGGDLEIRRGRELDLVAIEVVTSDAPVPGA